jgi:hypothetical protein
METKKYRSKIYSEDIVFLEPCQQYYWDHAKREYVGGKKGIALISHYVDAASHPKARIAFLPDAFKLQENSIINYSEVCHGVNVALHPALAVRKKPDNERAVVFGKAASMTNVNGATKKAIKTWWCFSFKRAVDASNFIVVCKYTTLVVLNVDDAAEEEAAATDEAAAVMDEVAAAKDEATDADEATDNKDAGKDRNPLAPSKGESSDESESDAHADDSSYVYDEEPSNASAILDAGNESSGDEDPYPAVTYVDNGDMVGESQPLF